MVTAIQALYACLAGLGLAAFAAGVYALLRSGPRDGEAETEPGRISIPPRGPARRQAPAASRKERVTEQSDVDPPKARSAGGRDT